MTSAQARQRAEKHFKQQERERDGKVAMSEYRANAMAVRKNMARLRALRLAKEAENEVSRTAPKG